MKFPIYKKELRKFIPLSLIFFCISYNHSLMRGIKDMLILMDGEASTLYYLKLFCVTPTLLIFAIIYSSLSTKFERQGRFNIIISYFAIFFSIFFILFSIVRFISIFIKFFFYLDNVGIDNGPFTYTKGSQIQKFDGWDSKYRWAHREISSIYGEDRIIKCTGNVGDLIIGNTNGFHKGSKVAKGERTLLSIYYGVHPTEWRSTFGGKMRKEHYESLPKHKKALADFLVRSEA